MTGAVGVSSGRPIHRLDRRSRGPQQGPGRFSPVRARGGGGSSSASSPVSGLGCDLDRNAGPVSATRAMDEMMESMQTDWGLGRARRLAVSTQEERRVPELARQVLDLLAARRGGAADRRGRHSDHGLAPGHPVSRRLVTIPGIGPPIATPSPPPYLAPEVVSGGCQFPVWLDLEPRQRSTGGKQRLGRINRLGAKSIRQLLIVGGISRRAASEGASGGAPSQCAGG